MNNVLHDVQNYSVLEIRCKPWIKALENVSFPLFIYTVYSLPIVWVYFYIFYLVCCNLTSLLILR